MKGAAAVPERNTSTPKNTITTTIGSSHHFLLCFRKYQNSATKPVLCRVPATCSKSDMLAPLFLAGRAYDCRRYSSVFEARGLGVQYEATCGFLITKTSRPIALKIHDTGVKIA